MGYSTLPRRIEPSGELRRLIEELGVKEPYVVFAAPAYKDVRPMGWFVYRAGSSKVLAFIPGEKVKGAKGT